MVASSAIWYSVQFWALLPTLAPLGVLSYEQLDLYHGSRQDIEETNEILDNEKVKWTMKKFPQYLAVGNYHKNDHDRAPLSLL